MEFTLIGQPDFAPALAQLPRTCARAPLVLYAGGSEARTFLDRILNAAGYERPEEQLNLLEWPLDAPLDLTGLVRHLESDRIICFGHDTNVLGIHFFAQKYSPVTVTARTFLFAEPLTTILEAKQNGNNGPAGALWGALKSSFLYTPA